VTPAWGGWSRPGRATEVDVRLTATASTRAQLDIVAGRQTVRAEVGLEPGRTLRLQVPVVAHESLVVTATSRDALPEPREIRIAQSESPLLGVALATDAAVGLAGFHTVTLHADDLPRNASAYASIDALVLDAGTLAALDERQLGALLAHAAACGRALFVGLDRDARRLIDDAAGCGGRSVIGATSLAEGTDLLKASLAGPGVAIPLAHLGGLAPASYAQWNRVLVFLAGYFGVAALALGFSWPWTATVLVPALAAFAAWAVLPSVPSPSQLVLWAETESGSRVAHYRARQRFDGHAREAASVPLPTELGPPLPCDANDALHLAFDADRGRATFAQVDARLFGQASLCYAGYFPIMRVVVVDASPEDTLVVRNAGEQAWPPGKLLARQRVHELPALAPNAVATIVIRDGAPPNDAAARAALSRTPAEGQAALWKLALDGVVKPSIDTEAWLLVSIPPR
jgi:hypothetical protein